MKQYPDVWKTEEKFSEENVLTIEKFFGANLPQNFKDYYQMVGPPVFSDQGLMFEASWKRIDGAQLSIEESEDFETEFGVYSLRQFPLMYEDIELFYVHSRKDVIIIPRRYLPITTDFFGMYLMMDLSPEKHGTIWAWFLSSDPWGEGDNLYIGFVADSYEDFLFNRLQEPPEDW